MTKEYKIIMEESRIQVNRGDEKRPSYRTGNAGRTRRGEGTRKSPSVGKEIENIPAAAGFSPVKLSITTLCAADRNKFFVLYIKYLCKISACGLKLI